MTAVVYAVFTSSSYARKPTPETRATAVEFDDGQVVIRWKKTEHRAAGLSVLDSLATARSTFPYAAFERVRPKKRTAWDKLARSLSRRRSPMPPAFHPETGEPWDRIERPAPLRIKLEAEGRWVEYAGGPEGWHELGRGDP